MEPIKITRYIKLGTCLRFLIDISEGVPVHKSNYIKDNTTALFNFLEEFDLKVTLRAAHDLRIFKTKIEKSGHDHLLTAGEAKTLRNIMLDLRKTLVAEASGNLAYIVTDKRINVDKLVSDVPALMALDVFDSLPPIAQYDFNEAGKCIAFSRPTAAAFHLLRGTEGVLRLYYCSIVKRKKDRVDPLMWGAMIVSLRKRSKPPPKELLNHLDNIRLSFRNPTQHPEMIYNIDEVQDLFNLCIDVVNRMAALL